MDRDLVQEVHDIQHDLQQMLGIVPYELVEEFMGTFFKTVLKATFRAWRDEVGEHFPDLVNELHDEYGSSSDEDDNEDWTYLSQHYREHYLHGY